MLEKVNNKILTCKICPVGKSGKVVVGEGSPDADVVFIGEAPGKKEAETGRPFIGRSGQLLRKLIQDSGFKEEEVYITSPVKYLPDRGTPTSKDIAHGRVHLLKQLEVISPKLVVLLGRVAAEGVLQKKVFVSEDHGKVIEERHLPAGRQVKYFLTYHPAAVLRFPNKFKKAIVEDFEKIQKLI
jgi:DNA polymerase